MEFLSNYIYNEIYQSYSINQNITHFVKQFNL
jgi:hypothetical protein